MSALRYHTFGLAPLERIRRRELLARTDVRTVRVPMFPDRNDGPSFSLAYADADAGGAGPVLVVLPGGPGLASVVPYLHVRQRLTAAGFRVLMPEHRGVGLSRSCCTAFAMRAPRRRPSRRSPSASLTPR